MEGSRKFNSPSGLSGANSRSGGGAPASGAAPSMFPFGSPINTSRRSILSPGGLPGQQPQQPGAAVPGPGGSGSGTPHVLRGRVRAQDVYGGPLAFGGTPTRARKSLLDTNATGRSFNADYSLLGAAGSQPPNGSMSEPLGGVGAGLGGTPHPVTPSGGAGSRRSRLMFSASPYHSAASARLMSRARPPPTSTAAPPRSNTPSPSSGGSSGAGSSSACMSGSVDGMSSTARLILDTLDKMSTPLRDAQKMLPFQDDHEATQTPSRAEKRKLIAEKLNLSNSAESSSASAAKRARRRPHLGGGGTNSDGGMLRGPPTRSTAFMSPLPARTKQRGPPPQALPKPDPVVNTPPLSAVKDPTPPPPPPPQQQEQPKLLFGQQMSGQQMSGGGKLKSAGATAKSSLRAPAPKVPHTAFGQAPAANSQPAAAAMPNITFSASSAKPAAVAGSSYAGVPAAAAAEAFTFSLPKKVGHSLPGGPLPNSEVFAFSAPQRLKSAATASAKSATTSQSLNASHIQQRGVLPDLMNSSPSNHPSPNSNPSTSTSTLKIPVMKMPSASVAPKPTTGLKAGSVMELLGGNRGKLPDVTSTGQQSSMVFGGIKPATELKTGSVMSILGQPNNEPTWDPKFKTSQRPWQ